MRAIFADNLQKKFGEKTMLDGVSLDISEGEIFGLLGPSGAGKTTLINIITGQLSQTGGYAEILGTDTRKAGDEVRRKIGVMTDIIGWAIGLLSPSRTAAHSVSIPLMLVPLLPLLSAFNNTIARASKVLFSEQIRKCFAEGKTVGMNTTAVIVSSANLVVALAVFVWAYRRSRRRT